MKKIFLLASIALFFSCAQQNSDKSEESKNQNQAFVWEGANVYFLMTDRFNNGDTNNDINFNSRNWTFLCVSKRRVKSLIKSSAYPLH